MSGIHFHLPFFYCFFFVLLALVISYVLYIKEYKKKILSRLTLRILFFLRCFSLTLILCLLLQPQIFQKENKTQKPILVFAQDNSKSILLNKDSSYYLHSHSDSVSNWMNSLRELYDVRIYTFGDKTKEESNFNYNSNSTNIENLYNEIENTFYSSNLTDLIIASDGIINLGSSPYYINTPKNITSHCVLLGDTNSYPDIRIKKINHNKYALLNNQFPIEAVLSSNTPCEKLTVSIFKNGELMEDKIIYNVEVGNTKVKFLDKSSNEGVNKYKITVSTYLLENNLSNNSNTAFVEIIDYSQKILILSSAPHPDVSSINWSLKDLQKSKIHTFLIDDFKEQISMYDLIVFHKPFDNVKMHNLLKEAIDNEIPSLVFTGNKLKYNELTISSLGMVKNNFKGSNLVSAQFNEDFNLFNFNNDWLNIVSKYPPLNIPFSSEYKLKGNSKVLFNQSLNGIELPYPLIYFHEKPNNIKYCVVLGEGVWKWKMSEFKNFSNAMVFKNIFQKIIQYLKKIDKKNRLKVNVPVFNYQDQALNINAEFYNASYELLEGANVEFKYIDSSGNQYVKTLNSVDKHYEIDLFNLNKGQYKYTLTATHSSESFSQNGEFKIIGSNRELLNTKAKLNSLKVIASYNKVYNLENLHQLINQLRLNAEDKQVYHTEKSTKDIIHYKWILFVILVLLLLEWWIRKNNGLI